MTKQETHKNYKGEVHQGKGIDCPQCKKFFEMLQTNESFGFDIGSGGKG